MSFQRGHALKPCGADFKASKDRCRPATVLCYFSDIPANRTYKLDPSGAISVWREDTKGTNGLFLLKDGRLLGAEGGGARVVAVTPDGRVTALATQSSGKPLRSPNDLIADKKGGIYFTDPAPRPSPTEAPKEPGNVHYIKPDGKTVLLLDDQIRRPNGITLSIDEKTLYVDDTEGEYVYAFDVQSDGTVKNKRQFVKLHDPEQGSLRVAESSRRHGARFERSLVCGHRVGRASDRPERQLPWYDSRSDRGS